MKYGNILAGHVSIVTGGGSGMSEATCKLFAEEGAKVVVADYNAKNGQRVADEIVAAGGEAVFFQVDVSSEEQCNAMAAFAIEKFGRIDDLMLFAGRTFDGDLTLTTQQRLQKTFEVNYYGVYYCCFACLDQMKKQKSGSIMIVSSSGAFSPCVPAYEYHTSKGACECLTLQLAFDVAPLGIRVNCIKPGLCITAFYDELPGGTKGLDASINMEIPMMRAGDPIDYAKVALFYASDLSSYVTGHLMYVAGGMGDIKAHAQSGLLAGGLTTARMHDSDAE